ncbi:MAG: GMC family oxidoreductase N-terminal domain-containing protein [Candidatus Woesearchaeota archaeon]
MSAQQPLPREPTGPSLARQEHQLRVALFLGAALFALEAAIYVPQVFIGPSDSRPYAINSVVKDVLFCVLALGAATDLAKRARQISLIVWGHVLIVVLLALALITGDSTFAFPPPQWLVNLIPALDVSTGARAVGWLIGAALATALLAWLLHRALVVRYNLRYLWPAEHLTLAAVADAILTDPVVGPDEIATAVDHYWASLDIAYKRRLRLAIWVTCLLPLLFLRPPFPLMTRVGRYRFLKRYFVLDVARRSELGFLRQTVQSALRFPMQLVYMGYYRDRRTDAVTGYVPFSERAGYPGDRASDPRLRVMATPDRHEQRLTADVVIVGTGAGGSIVAHQLAEQGREVLMLDRGRYLPPSQYVEDEPTQYAALYSDGALQLSRDFSFQVLQGMCVGGSTVVNNGVCFDIPEAVLARWNEPPLDAGLSPGLLRRSFVAVRELIGAETQNPARGNPIVRRVPSAGLAPVTANIHDCLGCGYCNIGCAFGRKLSMLERVLPLTQQATDEARERDPEFRGQLEILPECEVTAVRTRDGRATGVQAVLRLPDGGRRKLEIDAETVVLAAGAIHSSRILMASRLGGSPVGRGFSANLGSHMTALWSDGDALNAFEGLQMSHFRDSQRSGYVIETWFNPVMSQALVMPGWLNDHERNMRRYPQLGCLGVIAGSTRDGNRVLATRDLLSGSEVDFTPSQHDLGILLGGLREAGELLLDAGAECVMPATFAYHELRSREELSDLKLGGLVRDASDISVNTGHPQGGNPVSRNPTAGVVDEHFRVHGVSNLYVCDASVFPTAITVNPQLTVMALAHYAATHHIGAA